MIFIQVISLGDLTSGKVFPCLLPYPHTGSSSHNPLMNSVNLHLEVFWLPMIESGLNYLIFPATPKQCLF